MLSPHPEHDLEPPRWVGLEEIVDTRTFLLREIDDVGPLAQSLIRHGQLEAVDLRSAPDGLQLVSGHRRYAALRMLGRGRILARVHDGLSDEDALLLALSDDLDRRPWSRQERLSLRARLEERGLLSTMIDALLDRSEAQAAEGGGVDPEEMDANLMAVSIRARFVELCSDVALLFEVWGDVDERRRADLLECVEYMRDMHPFLSETKEER